MAKKKRKRTARNLAKKPAPKQTKGAAQRVGRGNPPKHTQFVKGQTGNPHGRPRGSKNVRTIIMAAARDQVTATIDGKPRKISKLQATAMQLATKAASGDQKAVGQMLDWVDDIETRAAAVKPTQFPFEKSDLEVLKAVYVRMKLFEEPEQDQ